MSATPVATAPARPSFYFDNENPELERLFRDERLAWVQTPQWFYDIPQGPTLEEWQLADGRPVNRQRLVTLPQPTLNPVWRSPDARSQSPKESLDSTVVRSDEHANRT